MQSLSEFTPEKNIIFCIDSDGCVFDTMEIKHKECFCPEYIDHFSLQAVSRFARDAWEYTNLYSQSRGRQRFVTLVESLDLLENRVDVQERGFAVPPHEALRRYINEATVLSNETLQAEAEKYPEAVDLENALEWSVAVNKRIGEMVHGVPPFPYVRECLKEMAKRAHIVIVSATPEEALAREWREHGIDKYVDVLCGQETGTKKDVIAALKKKNTGASVVMIGDAPGDESAAKKNDAMFYPITPSSEAQSWRKMLDVLPLIWDGKYAGETECKYEEEFAKCLPSEPWWKVKNTEK